MMIYQSILTMTVIDIVIVVLIGFGIYYALTWLRQPKKLGLSGAIWLMVTGMTLLGLLFAADLATMHVLPSITGMQSAKAAMDYLHHTLAWIIYPASISLLVLALVKLTHNALPRLQQSQSALQAKVVETSDTLSATDRRLRCAVQATRYLYWDYNIEQDTVWLSATDDMEALGLADALQPSHIDPDCYCSAPLRRALRTIIHPGDRDKFNAILASWGAGEASKQVDLRMRPSRDADWRWYCLRGFRHQANADGSDNIAGVLVDEHESRSRESNLLELSMAVENAMQGISLLDTDGNFIEVRSAYANMLGYEPKELVGQNWTVTVHPDDIPLGVATFEEMLEKGTGTGTCKAQRRDGSNFYKQLLLVKRVDENGDYIGHFCFMKDVSDEINLQQRLAYEATHDGLTALINRREFEKRLANTLTACKAHGGTHVLCYFDLDQFKVINDTLGHNAGDTLLRSMSKMLSQTVRSRDTLARIGGDEFAVLMEHCREQDGLQVAEKIRHDIDTFELEWQDIPLKISTSIGLIEFSQDSLSPADILKKADTACYLAKERGRNRIHVYGESDVELHRRSSEMEWIARIHDALQNDDFELHAQAIAEVGAQTPAAQRYEVLIRMKSAGKLIAPGRFLPAAERYNVSTKIDRWVAEALVSEMQHSPEWTAGIDWISMNLSGHSLCDLDFLEFLKHTISSYGVDGGKICFEITETATITYLEGAIHFIEELRSLGCRFALDDFGSGASSFGYLTRLDVDFIKIDGSIVKDILDDEASLTMVEAIRKIGNITGRKTIAEFVENAALQQELERIGVDFVQGYHIHEPQKLSAVSGGKELKLQSGR